MIVRKFECYNRTVILFMSMKRTYDPQRTRRRILDVAAERFQSRGYHATSMHEIMQLAGVPGGSVYHYFPTKKSLGLAVIDEDVAASVEQTWMQPVREAPSAREGIARVFQGVADQIERDGRGVTGCPVNNLTLELALTDPDFQSSLRGIFEAWTAVIADRIRADLKSGILSGVDPDETAVAIVANFSGAMALAKASQSAGAIRACAKQTLRLLDP